MAKKVLGHPRVNYPSDLKFRLKLYMQKCERNDVLPTEQDFAKYVMWDLRGELRHVSPKFATAVDEILAALDDRFRAIVRARAVRDSYQYTQQEKEIRYDRLGLEHFDRA